MSELPSGNVDLAPTVLHLLGVATDAALDGRPLLEGLHAARDQPRGFVSDRHETTCRVGGVSLAHHAVVGRVGHVRYVASLGSERP